MKMKVQYHLMCYSKIVVTATKIKVLVWKDFTHTKIEKNSWWLGLSIIFFSKCKHQNSVIKYLNLTFLCNLIFIGVPILMQHGVPLERRYFFHMVVGPQIQVIQTKVWHPLFLTPLGLVSSCWQSTNHFLDVHILMMKRSYYRHFFLSLL